MITAKEAKEITRKVKGYEEKLEYYQDLINKGISDAENKGENGIITTIDNKEVAEIIKKELWENGFTVGFTHSSPIILEVSW